MPRSWAATEWLRRVRDRPGLGEHRAGACSSAGWRRAAAIMASSMMRDRAIGVHDHVVPRRHHLSRSLASSRTRRRDVVLRPLECDERLDCWVEVAPLRIGARDMRPEAPRAARRRGRSGRACGWRRGPTSPSVTSVPSGCARIKRVLDVEAVLAVMRRLIHRCSIDSATFRAASSRRSTRIATATEQSRAAHAKLNERRPLRRRSAGPHPPPHLSGSAGARERRIAAP